MGDEPRRSGRATKGQHKNASSSPAPQPKPAKKSKPTKKDAKSEPEENEEEEEEEDETIRCICGNTDDQPFVACDACEVWQHNVCMGMPDNEDDMPDHYFCEQCRPEEHVETLQALERGEPIWETRNQIWKAEKAAEKRAKKGRKGRTAGWLKKDVPVEETAEEGEEAVEPAVQTPASDTQEPGSKRKREEVKEEPKQSADDGEAEKTTRASRQDKRRKSERGGSTDAETALIDIAQLPADRKKIAEALSKIVAEDLSARAKAGAYRIPDGQTSVSLGEHYASRIEYALKMNHEAPSNPKYMGQFRALNANLKKNKLLIERLLNGSLTADELSLMTSKEMASEELQKERAEMKEQLDRQAIAIQEEGPRYRRTHKGDELIEDENAQLSNAPHAAVQPVRERTSTVDEAGSPTEEQTGSPMQMDPPPTLKTEHSRQPSANIERKASNQQFDMNDIWAKTAQSPTTSTRPMQMPPRRRSSIPQQQDGTKEDADVDRMLQDDEDETYSPAEYTGDDAVVWRGKLVQGGDDVAPTVNARFVAGRDISGTVPWSSLLPDKLNIDGRLQSAKAEEYVCSLQYSHTSDVSVLALTPYDDADAFETLFTYFKSRDRYAVVNSDKPPMVRDLYIIPVDAGQELPSHVGLLEVNKLQSPLQEKCLLATFVIHRALAAPPVPEGQIGQQAAQLADSSNGQYSLPQHMRGSVHGPAGSPLNTTSATFSPTGPNTTHQQPVAGYGSTAFPPYPYGQSQSPPQGAAPPVPLDHPNYPLISSILGNFMYAPTAQQIIQAQPDIDQLRLTHLREILMEVPLARDDMTALSTRLTQRG